MNEFERVNSAAFKAEFTKYRDQVLIEKRPVIVQRNNKDMVALIPIEDLRKITKGKERNGK